MDVQILKGLILTLPLGLAIFISRLYIFRKREDKKHILIQIVILFIYIIVLSFLQYNVHINQELYGSKFIVYLWLGFYFIFEPIITFITLFMFNKDENMSFIDYIIKALVWTFLLDALAVAILMVWFMFNLPY